MHDTRKLLAALLATQIKLIGLDAVDQVLATTAL